MNIGEILIGALTGPLEAVATEKLGEVFRKLQAKDPSAHAATVKALHIGIQQLERVTDATKTKIDDAVVGALAAAVVASAEEFGVELPQ